MTDTNIERALKRYTQWFGSYKRSGELVKIQVWLTVNAGRIEFLTRADTYKVKRIRRNARVICFLGSQDGPAIAGRAEIITDPEALWRAYRAFTKIYPLRMFFYGWAVRRQIQAGKRVLVRVHPDEPNPLAGLTDPVV